MPNCAMGHTQEAIHGSKFCLMHLSYLVARVYEFKVNKGVS